MAPAQEVHSAPGRCAKWYNEAMTSKDLVDYWLSTAEDDWQTAQALFTAKRYHHALFFCHLTIEKLLKGLVFVRTKKHAFPIHRLGKLAQQAGITLTEEQGQQFDEITSWNVNARYDTIKREFYNKATKTFTTKWMGKVKEYYIWLKKQY